MNLIMALVFLPEVKVTQKIVIEAKKTFMLERRWLSEPNWLLEKADPNLF